MRPDVVNWLDQFLPREVALSIAPTWFMCVGLGGLGFLIWMVLRATRRDLDTGVIASAVLWSYLAAVVAGIVVPMVIECVTVLITTGRFRVRWAGMTSFWGYLAGFGAVWIVCRRNGLPLARYGDMAAAPLGLSLVFARLGCFLGGCDYGKVTSVPWAVRFPAGSPAWKDQIRAGVLPSDRMESLPVHPTQLYEAALGLLTIAVTLWIARRAWAREGSGRVFLAFAATYALGRMGIEALRGDLGRGIYGGLSSGQIFSLCVLVAIAMGLFFARRRALVAIGSVASLVVILLGDLHPAHAQPQPQPMQSQEPYGPAMMAPQPSVAAASDPDHHDKATSHIRIGGLLGMQTPLNRRADQVSALAGGSLSFGLTGVNLGIWLDVDSYGNRDASHGTVLVSGSFTAPLGKKLSIGGRVGVGRTLVNFDEPAFKDVSGSTMRFEGTLEYAIADSWLLWVRPLSFDILTAADLGGPITTYQMRVGAAFRFGLDGQKRAREEQQRQQRQQQQPLQPGVMPQPGAPPQGSPQPQPAPGGYYWQGQPQQGLPQGPPPAPYPPQGQPQPSPPAPAPSPAADPGAPRPATDPNQVPR